MKINAQNLMASGYRHFPHRPGDPEHRAGLFQKKVEDENGVRYFVTVEQYDFSDLHVPDVVKRANEFSPNGQFRRGDDNNITLSFQASFGSEATIQDMEAFFEELFTKMDFNYYERRDWTPAP